MTVEPDDQPFPTDYEAGRFLLRLPLPTGRTARLLVDTCGGFVLGRACATGLRHEPTGLPDFPARVDLDLDPPVLVGRRYALVIDGVVSGDGVLPAGWFADRIWSFDYRARTLTGTGSPAAGGSSAPLRLAGRDRDSPGAFPTVDVVIDTEMYPVFLDTGATARLSDAAVTAVGDGGPSERASSFMSASAIERWRRRHPGWRVVTRPTAPAALMIEVASVRLAGVDLGPVWFESRPDDTFARRMTDLVGHPVAGALGGAPFHDRHRLVLDFRAARLHLD